MLMLGLVLVVLGVLAILAAIFLSGGAAELIGLDLPTVAIFLAGAVAGACLVGGAVLIKQGTKREWRVRRDRKQLRHYQENERGSTGAAGTASGPTAHGKHGGSPGGRAER